MIASFFLDQTLFLVLFFVFIFGTIIGSFLNVVILRYNTGRSINGRSGCLSCGYKLRPIDLIPVFSWLFLKGKCRNCGSKISIQYPMVEFFTGLIFVALFLKTLPLFDHLPLAIGYFVWQAIIFSILIVIFVYDLRHKIIPNSFSYAFAIISFLGLVLSIPVDQFFSTPSILNLLAGPILFTPFFILWFISKGNWIGLGDGKLALGMGWFLGLVYGLSAVVLGFWIGAIFSLFLLLINRLFRGKENITMKSEIPFAPFLVIATAIEFFFKLDLLNLKIFF